MFPSTIPNTPRCHHSIPLGWGEPPATTSPSPGDLSAPHCHLGLPVVPTATAQPLPQNQNPAASCCCASPLAAPDQTPAGLDQCPQCGWCCGHQSLPASPAADRGACTDAAGFVSSPAGKLLEKLCLRKSGFRDQSAGHRSGSSRPTTKCFHSATETGSVGRRGGAWGGEPAAPRGCALPAATSTKSGTKSPKAQLFDGKQAAEPPPPSSPHDSADA